MDHLNLSVAQVARLADNNAAKALSVVGTFEDRVRAIEHALRNLTLHMRQLSADIEALASVMQKNMAAVSEPNIAQNQHVAPQIAVVPRPS